MNKEISDMHAELDATEREIAELENVEEVEPELERTTLENRV